MDKNHIYTSKDLEKMVKGYLLAFPAELDEFLNTVFDESQDKEGTGDFCETQAKVRPLFDNSSDQVTLLSLTDGSEIYWEGDRLDDVESALQTLSPLRVCDIDGDWILVNYAHIVSAEIVDREAVTNH